MRHRGKGWGLGLVLLLAGAVPHAGAQESEVAAAVRATLDAWKGGQYEVFLANYHADARGFFLDGSPLMRGFNLGALQAAAQAGFKADVTVKDLEVQVHGGTATSVGYLVGTLTLPGGLKMPGTWRYSETRIQADGTWKIVQFHISAQAGTGM